MSDELDRLIGETLVFGIPGPRPTVEDLRLFRETHAGGLILYRINFRSPEQICGLIRGLEESLGRRLRVTVDHEGGRVVMFESGVTVFPDNLAFGVADRTDWARAQGTIEGRELRRLGVDVNFSPTVDVLTEAFSPNIGIRSYGRDPAQVARLASARIRALQRQGVSACAKHFPGLGPATKDPHLDLPVIDVGWAELRRRHLVPFRAAIDAGVDLVMSSHPLYPKLDPRPRTPATFSRRLMTDLLRKEMGFRGVVASDDLEMGALGGLAGVGRAAVLAARAGHDLILCCHQRILQREVARALRDAYRSGELKETDLVNSVQRIRRLRGSSQPRFTPGALRADPSGESLARRVADAAVRVRPGRAALPFLNAGKVQVIFPRLSDLARRIMIEPALRRERSFLLSRIGPVGRMDLFPLDPSPALLRRAVRGGRSHDATVFFCFDAHLHPGLRRLLAALEKENRPLVLVLMRDPYDGEYASARTTLVSASGFRQSQIEACLKKVFPS
ncbi:MAG: beta-N-acetylhexosaminidase [Elusimicrobia bacterium]|nr:beta-N-acetylhexosaminidase [Elusimicrobiota bacterium]